jgi:hypothetical protein
MNQQKIEKELRFLKIYAGVATLCCAIFFLTAFSVGKNAKFDEIDVKRINVKDDDGKLRMVISNKDRQHYGISDGKPIERKNGRPTPGIIFFNHLGDEMGGLIVGELRAKSQTFPTSKTGLQNLIVRYSFLTEKRIEILQDTQTFTVKVPLILNK